MNKKTYIERLIIWILKSLKIIETKEVSKYEMCKRAQEVCNHNCSSCAWNNERSKNNEL